MYFAYQSLIWCAFGKYFLSNFALSSHSLDNMFCRAQVLNFNEVQLIDYVSHELCLWSCSKKVYPRSSRFSPKLSSRSFIVLHCTFRSVIWVNFCDPCTYPVAPALFAVKILSVPFYCLCSFVKDQLTVFMWIRCWALCSVPLIRNLFSQQYHTVLIIVVLCCFEVK